MINSNALAAIKSIIAEITKLVERNEPTLAGIVTNLLRSVNSLLEALDQPSLTITPYPPYVAPLMPAPWWPKDPSEPIAVYYGCQPYGPVTTSPPITTLTTSDRVEEWYDTNPVSTEVDTQGSDSTSSCGVIFISANQKSS